MKKLKFIIACLTGIMLFSCVDPYIDDTTLIQDTNVLPAASYMEKTDSLGLSLWVELLKYTGLYNSLNLAGSFTCFVPDNNAMNAYLANAGKQNVTELTIDAAKNLVKYHTIKDASYSAVSFDEGVIPDSTASGDYLATTFNENGGQVIVNLEASVTKTVKTNNAYIHIIDNVLTPVTQTIWEKLQDVQFSVFRAAVEAAGFRDRLNTVSDVIDGVTFKYRYTIFAVPDSVYAADGINNLQQLADFLNAGENYTAPENELNKYVAYHLINQQLSYASLSFFEITDTKRSKNYATMAQNQLINISEVNKTLYLNYNTTLKTGVELLIINRNCKNGVLHMVDGVLPVESPKPTTFQWELTDFSVLASTLPRYRTSGLTSTYIYQLIPEITTCYNWLSVPESKPGLFYIIANKNDAVPYKAKNYDYLRLNMGTYGWVEMTTPAIVAGTYKVTVEHYNPLAAEAQGKIWIIIDGAYIGNQVATRGASKTSNQLLKTQAGTITFPVTTTHKVRILSADNFTSDIDCLTFTP